MCHQEMKDEGIHLKKQKAACCPRQWWIIRWSEWICILCPQRRVLWPHNHREQVAPLDNSWVSTCFLMQYLPLCFANLYWSFSRAFLCQQDHWFSALLTDMATLRKFKQKNGVKNQSSGQILFWWKFLKIKIIAKYPWCIKYKIVNKDKVTVAAISLYIRLQYGLT